MTGSPESFRFNLRKRDDIGLQALTVRALMAAQRHAFERPVTLNSKHSHWGSAFTTIANRHIGVKVRGYSHNSSDTFSVAIVKRSFTLVEFT